MRTPGSAERLPNYSLRQEGDVMLEPGYGTCSCDELEYDSQWRDVVDQELTATVWACEVCGSLWERDEQS